MSQPSSPSSPRRPDSDSHVGASDSAVPETPRRLLSPRERFSTDLSENFVESVADEKNADETASDTNFDVAISPRLEEEMARRHVPPRERRHHERARIQREKREQKRRFAQGHARHPHHSAPESTRTHAERDFSLAARVNTPAASPKPRRMPRFLKRILWLVALIFLGQLGFAAFTAPQFEIKGVEIDGLDATPPEMVRPLASRLLGQNLLRVNRARVEAAVRLVPTVADAKVVRLFNWPPKVALQVTERQALLKVGSGQNWWVIDQNGVAFRRPNAEDAALYSVVAPQFTPELRQKLPAKIWARVVLLNAAIRHDNDLVGDDLSPGAKKSQFWELRRIYFDKNGLASLRVSRAAHREMLVRLGDDAWPEKLARARVALAYFERTGRQAAELDLVSLERPVWSPMVAPNDAKLSPKAD